MMQIKVCLSVFILQIVLSKLALTFLKAHSFYSAFYLASIDLFVFLC